MIYVCDKTLALFRGSGHCPWCFERSSRFEPHHIRKRGMGGGARLDIRINLVPLCGAMTGGKNCHVTAETQNDPSRDDLLSVVARREQTTPEAIEAVVSLILRLPKDAHLERIEAELAGLDRLTRTLAKRTFKEMGIRWRATK